MASDRLLPWKTKIAHQVRGCQDSMGDDPKDVTAAIVGSSEVRANLTKSERAGRALGKAFTRVKRTKVWTETSQAFRDGLDGKEMK
jgi:hypothetical protein